MKTIVICVGLFLAVAGYSAVEEHAPVDKDARQTSAQELQEAFGKGKKILVVDVRSPQEFATGHIPGAINIPFDELAKKLEDMKVSKDTTLVTICEHGGRSSRAALQMEKLGYKTSSFCTLDSWRKGGYKIETGNVKPQAAMHVYRFTCHHYCNGDKQTPDLDQHCDCACNQPFRECMKES
jgi:phage shock protein E